MRKTTTINPILSGFTLGTTSALAFSIFANLQVAATGVPMGVAAYNTTLLTLFVFGTAFGTISAYLSGRMADAKRKKREVEMDELAARRAARRREFDALVSQDPA